MRILLKISLALLLVATHAKAFSLLGPYQPWMDTTNGFRQPGDIGGPMNIGEEYRWNVPVLTYGFDKSFLDYFGTNGVVAVEQAIQILNDLPSASNIVLNNYSLETKSVNFAAQAQSLYDLKSTALYLLIEQLSLGEPTRNVFDLRRWNPIFLSQGDENLWPPETNPNYIIERNFDPFTFAPSHFVDDVLYTGTVFAFGPFNPNPRFADVFEVLVDPLSSGYPAVADRYLESGKFYTGLTRDDVGGLRYLLATNNINYETLLLGIHGIGTDAASFVNGALRPGVDKITFIQQPFDSLLGKFSPATNQFTDTYITNGIAVQQQLERVVTEPDFLFSVGGADVEATDSSHWLNHAVPNGNPSGAGPGIIRPPVKIRFPKRGLTVQTSDSYPEGSIFLYPNAFGSFDGTTNPVVVYPNALVTNNSLTIRLSLPSLGGYPTPRNVTWELPVALGGHATLQTSTNLTNWTTLTTVTNNGTDIKWFHTQFLPRRFFRVVPE